MHSKEKLITDITAKSVIVRRIFWLSRISGDYNGNTILIKIKQRVLFTRFNEGQNNTEPINAKQALNCIGKLGGYISSNSAIITTWQGWTGFMCMADDYKIICGYKKLRVARDKLLGQSLWIRKS